VKMRRHGMTKKATATATAKAVTKAVALIHTNHIEGTVEVTNCDQGVHLRAHFTKLPPGKHGFHIHKAGDLRGEGCQGLCEHYDVGRHTHGGAPSRTIRHTKRNYRIDRDRHTGDLGNIEIKPPKKEFKRTYCIKNTSVQDLWGRSIIVHEGEDDLGKGGFEDSKTTGHSGKRIGCAIFGRGH